VSRAGTCVRLVRAAAVSYLSLQSGRLLGRSIGWLPRQDVYVPLAVARSISLCALSHPCACICLSTTASLDLVSL